jgi:hypothetical protein
MVVRGMKHFGAALGEYVVAGGRVHSAQADYQEDYDLVIDTYRGPLYPYLIRVYLYTRLGILRTYAT